MQRIFIFLLFLISSSTVFSQDKNTSDKDIDRYIKKIQETYRLPGLALAIVRDGKVIHRGNYGFANLEFSTPVSNDTLFPLFSSTKIMSVIAVHQLIEQGKLSLDDELGHYLDDLPLAWRKVKVIHLLTHSSGLPDIVEYENDEEKAAKEKIYADPIKFTMGDQFDYNQTNFWLLNRLFQKILHKTLSTYVIETQFSGAQSEAIFEGNNLKVIKNLSVGYNNSGDQLYKRNWHFQEYNYGAAGLNISMNAFLEWDKKLDDGRFISSVSMKKMLTPFAYAKARDFALGWDYIPLNGKVTYGFTGGMSTAYRKVPEDKLTLILLANGMFIPKDNQASLGSIVNQLILMANTIK